MSDSDPRDNRAIWYYAGQADKRSGRPPAVDRADTSEMGQLYLAGYGLIACSPWQPPGGQTWIRHSEFSNRAAK